MDRPDLPVSLHEQALRGLARTNGWGVTRQLLWKTIRDLALRRSLRRVRILDAASGAGDFAIWLKRQAMRHRLPLSIDGCDRSPVAVEFATRRATEAGVDDVHFVCRDLVAEPLDATYDVVVCSLFLHHLTDAQGRVFLANMGAAARHALLLDDLRRTVQGYALARFASLALTRSPIVRIDAPLSVRAAFQEDEALALFAAAGLQGAVARRHWPQRYLITWQRTNRACVPLN